MYYYKQLKNGEITCAEPKPPRDLAAEIDNLKAGIEAIRKYT